MKISGKYAKPNYSVLAHIYDTLMEDVNYEMWADYIDEIIQEHFPAAESVLELACGTGTLALLLDELGIYVITATDASGEMIKRAREKAGPEHSEITFRTMNFLNIDLKDQYDVVFMVFDSLNYIHTEEEILELHHQVNRVLRPGGFFIYDFTTPRNSLKALTCLHNEEGVSPDNYRYYRKSEFDPANNIHVNEFEIEKLDESDRSVERRFTEIHRQKIYTFEQMLTIVKKTGFRIAATYDGFTLKQADKKSLRITMVLQWKTTV